MLALPCRPLKTIRRPALAAGEDDYRVCLANGVISKGEGIPCPVDDAGCFVDPVTDFKGMYCKVRSSGRWHGKPPPACVLK